MKTPRLHTGLESFFRESISLRTKFKARYQHFYQDDVDFFQKVIQADSTVLIIGCDVTGLAERLRCKMTYVLELTSPRSSVVSLSPVEVVSSIEEAFHKTPIDYVILPYTLQFLEHIQELLEVLRTVLLPQARIVVLEYSFLWSPLFKIAQRLSLKTPSPDLNWLNLEDMRNLLVLTGCQEVTSGGRCLMPGKIPFVTTFCNRFLAPLPVFQWLCLKAFMIARPLRNGTQSTRVLTASVIVPARNEAGNIAKLIERLPTLGPRCEVIFVEGHSQDGTWEEIQRLITESPRKQDFAFLAFQQSGVGKADAVHLGVSKATGDILMILDADLSVQPEDLLHFHSALVSGSAEFLNGSRLVYKMEREAMQILNLFFNKLFGLLLSWLMGQRVKDTLCGTKALFRRDYERIRRNFPALGQLDPFGDFELLFGAARLHLKICDVPVRYKERTYGRTNIQRFRNGWQLLRMVLVGWNQMK